MIWRIAKYDGLNFRILMNTATKSGFDEYF
jgi:hypothetical protein